MYICNRAFLVHLNTSRTIISDVDIQELRAVEIDDVDQDNDRPTRIDLVSLK